MFTNFFTMKSLKMNVMGFLSLEILFALCTSCISMFLNIMRLHFVKGIDFMGTNLACQKYLGMLVMLMLL